MQQGNIFSNRHTLTPFLSLLIKIIQSFLETIRIILRLLGSISPLFFKVGTGGWQWFALNQCRNIIGNIVGLVFARVSTKGFASATVDKKLFKVGLCVFDDCLFSLVYRVRHSMIVVYLMGASSMGHVISEQAQRTRCDQHTMHSYSSLTCIFPNPAGVRQLPSIHLQNGTAPDPNKFTLSVSIVPCVFPYPYSCSSFNRSNADVSGS